MGNDTNHAIRPLPPFHRIGYGVCGSVWSIENPGMNTSVIKREDMNEARSIHNDFPMYRKLLSAIHELRLLPKTTSQTSRVSVPACHQYVRADESTWQNTRLSRFPEQYQALCDALVTERIYPFAQAARECLIDRFCAPRARETIKSSVADRDCITRVYLGRRKLSDRPSPFYKLRNFPMSIDQMKQLNLDVDRYTIAMTDMLDANDVEFVLALHGSPAQTRPSNLST